jgi:D-alanyl-D-alanine carboxypeptidase/D-alanyl-D-alanine-endopeptidase (penicillin-binding protein 4)
LTTFLRGVKSTSYGATLANGLPVLGRSGTVANVLPKSQAAGHVQVKTGNRVVGSPTGQEMLLGNSLAGYLKTKSGRRVSFAIVVSDVPANGATTLLAVTNEQAKMIAAMYKAL